MQPRGSVAKSYILRLPYYITFSWEAGTLTERKIVSAGRDGGSSGPGITHRNYAKQCGLSTLSSYHQVALHTSPCLSPNARTPRRQ